jgi:hypothetical protein
MIRLKIDEHICESEAGVNIIEVADRYGIIIPRFCYHSNLSVAANCRMCLVEVSNSSKPVPACATPVSDGLVVFTKSEKTQEAQKSVLEFLLVNHPLDCPVCDQGGECELQDLTMAHGNDRSHYTDEKREVPNLELGPLIATEMNRCIHCTRCIRFGVEIAGTKEIAAFGRGEDTRVSNALEQNLRSSISGNIIDLCPVGALTSKPHRYKGRTWQYHTMHALSVYDMGRSRLLAHVYHGQIRRMASYGQNMSSDYWISDRDRFGFLGMNQDRFDRPMQWTQGAWKVLTQEELYSILYPIHQKGASWAGWFHPMSSEEDKISLKQYINRSLHPRGVFDLSHRSIDLSAQGKWDLNGVQEILLIGAFWESQQPIAWVHLRQWMNNCENSLTQLTFCKDIMDMPGSQVYCIGLDFWEDFVQKWISQGEMNGKKVFIHAQFLGHQGLLERIIKICIKKSVNLYILGQEAPLDRSEKEFQGKTMLPAQVIVTLHMEAQDFSQNYLLRKALEKAEYYISFMACRPEKGIKEGQIIIPIAAPLEYAGTYKSSWEYQSVSIEPVVSAPLGVLSFNALIDQWLEKAPSIAQSRIVSLSHEKDSVQDLLDSDAYHTSVLPKVAHLIVLQNAVSLNMILRRSRPLHKTPTALLQKGFWISSDLVDGNWQEGPVTIEDDSGNRWTDHALVSKELAFNTIIYWCSVHADELCFGNFCSLEID